MTKINRKTFFKGIAFGAISLPFLIRSFGGVSRAQNTTDVSSDNRKFTWKMVTTWPPNFPVLGEGANLLSKWVKEMSGGRLEIKVFGSGELVPALEVFDTVKSGAADIGSGASYYWAGKIPAAQFFASVPFGMNAQQLNAWINNGGGLELWEEIYAPHNLVPMLGGNTGVQMGGWFNKEINTIDDFKGLKMRMPGLGGKVLQKAGGSPVLLAGSELYTGLERGIIDATEWIGPYHDYKMGFHQIAKYYYTPGWHELGTALEIIVNKEKMESLPTDLQAILRTAVERLNSWTLSEFEAQNGIFLEKLIKEENVEVRKFTPAILQTLKSYTEDVLLEISQQDEMSKKVYNAYQNFRNKVKIWSDVSEKEYYQSIQK